MRDDNNYKYTFTVFTPTFNRAHTLERVYEALKAQTFKDFEWLIVDDGSKDITEEIVHNWMQESIISIRYFKKENGGKHTAINMGVNEALGKFFLIHDSDDYCIPETLETLKFYWDEIPEDKKNDFSGVSVLCFDDKNRIVGDKYPSDIIDISPLKLREKYNIKGEKWGFHKTDIFKEFPFPVYDKERFVAEGLIWNRMALKYKVRHVNEPLRYYEFSEDGLVAQMLRIRINSPKGTRAYYRELSTLRLSKIQRIKSLINYSRFSYHGNLSTRDIISESSYKFLTFLICAFGYMYYLKDNIKK
jgi:glycosyltransferase involved in cell wall biosynthesis